jgi:histidinol-phosphatase (PHP family)
MRALSDFHIHPNYSLDAEGTIRQYCDRALEIGMKHICFTTHYDPNPKRIEQDGYWRFRGERVRFTDELVGIYFDEIEKAKEYFSQLGLGIYRGLEIDYFPGVENEAERIRNKFGLDFAIGSVHCIDDIGISDPREAPTYFLKKDLSQMADDYFSLLCQAAECKAFDSLGHLDYYVRYGRKYYGDAIDHIELERFDDVFGMLKKSGVGIEVNTSPYRYGAEKFHPRREIIERAIAAGVRINSIGSDSHKPSMLSLGAKDAHAYLESKNIKLTFPKV